MSNTTGGSVITRPRSSTSTHSSMRNLTAAMNSHSIGNDTAGAISLDALDQWHDELEEDPKWKLAQTVLSRIDFNFALQNRAAKIDDQMVFSHKIEMEGNPVANQLQSGRCWLFAMTNVVRIFTARKFNLDAFQLSQSYLFFYDHLSKANWFLEQIIDLAHKPLDDETVRYILDQGPMQDGGQWDLAVSLVEAFGLVPQTVYPESWNSSHSAELDKLLTSKLREFALDLRVRWAKNVERMKHSDAMEDVRALKMEQMEVVFRVLTIACGAPPKPDEEFTWEFTDKKGKYHSLTTTPLEFAKVHVGYDVSDTITLVNDPRHEYNTVLTVERLGNVVGGRKTRYLNVPIEVMKRCAIDLIKGQNPVWFAVDVDKDSMPNNGFMDLRIWNYEDAFGTRVTSTKEERIRLRDSMITHAMMFTAVHLDSRTGKSVRWRVENSWGPEAGNKGFLVMTDDWFTEYLFALATPRHILAKHLLEIYDHADATLLPPWDPFGAAAA
ncbi:C1 family peptidase [Sporobolomyces salmoneus]|uniref:C1 family peptidase n=1 Tax=Sporobolomyces salmoneus TaxID=183962 RepID=UPI003176D15C